MRRKHEKLDLMQMRISIHTNVYDYIFQQSQAIGISVPMMIRMILGDFTKRKAKLTTAANQKRDKITP